MDYHNKTYIDALIGNYFDKTENDTLLSDKVDSTTFNTANQQIISVGANLKTSKLLKTNTADIYIYICMITKHKLNI